MHRHPHSALADRRHPGNQAHGAGKEIADQDREKTAPTKTAGQAGIMIGGFIQLATLPVVRTKFVLTVKLITKSG
jgi:hypothetical protein